MGKCESRSPEGRAQVWGGTRRTQAGERGAVGAAGAHLGLRSCRGTPKPPPLAAKHLLLGLSLFRGLCSPNIHAWPPSPASVEGRLTIGDCPNSETGGQTLLVLGAAPPGLWRTQFETHWCPRAPQTSRFLFLSPHPNRAPTVRSERWLMKMGCRGGPGVGRGYPMGTRTVGAFAAVARGLGPLRPPRATTARARRGEMEWRSRPC